MLSSTPVAAKVTARAVMMRLIGAPPVYQTKVVISRWRLDYEPRKALATRS
jgi:hypothetical protein